MYYYTDHSISDIYTLLIRIFVNKNQEKALLLTKADAGNKGSFTIILDL